MPVYAPVDRRLMRHIVWLSFKGLFNTRSHLSFMKRVEILLHNSRALVQTFYAEVKS